MAQSWITKLASVLAGFWYRLDARHRRITLRNLEFAYGPGLAPESRERLAREVFRQFVLAEAHQRIDPFTAIHRFDGN